MKHRSHVNPLRSIGFIVSSIAIGFGLHLALENVAAAAPLSGPLLSALGSLQTAKALLERDSGPDNDGSRARALQATNEAIDALKGAMNPVAGLSVPLPGSSASLPGLSASRPGLSAPLPGPSASRPGPSASLPSPSASLPGPSASRPGPSTPAACTGCATSASAITVVTTSSNTYTTQDIQAALNARKAQLLKCFAMGWHPNTEGRLDYGTHWSPAQGKWIDLVKSPISGTAMNSAVLSCMNSAIAGGSIRKTTPSLAETGALITLRITQ
jgi:hypothetical protein